MIKNIHDLSDDRHGLAAKDTAHRERSKHIQGRVEDFFDLIEFGCILRVEKTHGQNHAGMKGMKTAEAAGIPLVGRKYFGFEQRLEN